MDGEIKVGDRVGVRCARQLCVFAYATVERVNSDDTYDVASSNGEKSVAVSKGDVLVLPAPSPAPENVDSDNVDTTDMTILEMRINLGHEIDCCTHDFKLHAPH